MMSGSTLMTSDTQTKVRLCQKRDARRCVDFVLALGRFLFVLPARIKRGLVAAALNAAPSTTSGTASDTEQQTGTRWPEQHGGK